MIRISKRELRLAGLAVCAAGALVAAIYLLSLAFAPPLDLTKATIVPPDVAVRRSQVENTITGTADIAPFFDRLHILLPSDYDAAIRKAAATPAGSATDTPDYWLSDAVKIVRQSHGALAAKADAGPLSDMFAKQAAVLTALASKDARLCVDFLYGGADSGFFDFAAENRPLVGALALAGLEAIASGQTQKIERVAPTDEDFQLLENALREKGLDDTEIGALLDGKAPDPPLARPPLVFDGTNLSRCDEPPAGGYAPAPLFARRRFDGAFLNDQSGPRQRA